MKKSLIKKLLSCLVLCAVLLLNYNISYAYQIKTKDGKYILPLNKVTYYYIASNCDTSAIAPIQNGMSTWNAAPPTTFKLNLVNANKSNYRYNLSNPQDYINTIGTAITINEIDKVMEKKEKGIPIKKVVDLKLN